MAQKFNEMTNEELATELLNTEAHYESLRFNNFSASLENTAQIRSTRRTIARIKTEMRARELNELEAKGEVKRDRIRARRRRERANN